MGNCRSSRSSSDGSFMITRSSSITTTTVNDLNEDELMMIFLRLPFKSAHRSKCVCKHWFSLISHPYFAKSYLKVHPNKLNFLLLHYSDYRTPHQNRIYFARLYCLNNQNNNHLTDSKAENPQMVTYDFIRDDMKINRGDDFTLRLLSVQNGFVLLEADNFKQQVLFLCNPITKQWVRIMLMMHSERHDCVDFLCEENIFISSFTVVRIWITKQKEGRPCFCVSVYISSTDHGDWSKYYVPWPLGFRPQEKFHTQMLVVNGKFHWNGRNCIVAYDPFIEPNKCKLINSPIDGTFNLASYKGRIRIWSTRIVPHGSLPIWELMDYSNTDSWSLRYSVNCFPIPGDLYSFTFSESNEDEAYFIKYRCKSINLVNMRSSDASERGLSRVVDPYAILEKVAPLTVNAWPARITNSSFAGDIMLRIRSQ